MNQIDGNSMNLKITSRARSSRLYVSLFLLKVYPHVSLVRSSELLLGYLRQLSGRKRQILHEQWPFLSVTRNPQRTGRWQQAPHLLQLPLRALSTGKTLKIVLPARAFQVLSATIFRITISTICINPY
jgi:hypothetical protein